MKNFFRKYPHWYYSLLSGAFIYVFLKVFKPFGFQGVPGHILDPLFLGYGLIGFLGVLLNHLFLGGLVIRHFPDKGTRVRTWFWPMWIALTVTLANVVFTRWYFVKTGLSSPEDFDSWPVVVGTLALAFLCIFFIEIIDQNIRLRQNLKIQELANQKLKEHLPQGTPDTKTGNEILLWAQNRKDSYRFNAGEIIFFNAEENYVAIHFKREKIERVLVRNTISALTDQLKDFHPQFFRCHRRFIVNIRKIRSVTGNALGFRLFLDQVTDVIPVSRSYVPEFREIVKKHL